MQYQFENVGMPDRRAIIEMRYRIGAKTAWILMAVYLLLGAIFLRFHLHWGTSLFAPILFFGGAVYFAFLPYLQVRKAWKKDLAFHDGKMPVNTARFGEKISIENAMASRAWEYYHLVKVYSFRYSYGLRFADQTVLLLDRTNFTQGTFAEFKQFLRAKRPDLKIPE